MNEKIQHRNVSDDVPRISDIGTVRGKRVETDRELRQRLSRRRTHSDATMWAIVGLALVIGLVVAILAVIIGGTKL